MSDEAANSHQPRATELAAEPAVTPLPAAAKPATPIKISFLTDASGERAYWVHFLAKLHGLSPLVRRERTAGMLVAAVGAAIFGGAFTAFIAGQDPDARRFAPLAGVLIAIPFLMTGVGGGAWTKWRRSVRAVVNQQVGEPVAVTVMVSADGFTIESIDSAQTIRWSGIDRIVRVDRWIMVCHLLARDVDAVPISAFPCEADAEAWLVHARQLLDESGHGPDARARAAIDRGPVRCGRCGYSLVGVRVAQCPECGIDLSPFQIELWRTLQMPFRRQMGSMWKLRG